MNCFNHRTQPAVALCRACSKGVCPECLVEVQGSISCRGDCKVKVATMNRMVQQNAQILSTSNKTLKSAAVFVLFMGAIFLLFGLWQLKYGSGFLAALLSVIGLGFVFSGLLRFRKSAQYPNENDQ